MSDLQSWLDDNAPQFAVPGVAAGVVHKGAEEYGFFGVTRLEDPIPVDANTLFQIGSTGKTFTATAIMRLVEQGSVSLDAPVRRYVPELELQDESVAERVTVLHLLNHTAGWAGDIYTGTGSGDDSLAKFIALMANLPQEFPLGSAVSYNNTALALAGRIIEKVTGKTFDQAISDLLFIPLGMGEAFYLESDIVSRRHASGHAMGSDGDLVVTPFGDLRGMNPAGGVTTTPANMLKWARFHMGDGRSESGERILSRDSLDLMQTPTFDLRGSALGDYVGITWFIEDVGEVRLVEHGGNLTGFGSSFVMAPEAGFAITVLANSAAGGAAIKSQLVRWALQEYLGVRKPDPEPIDREEADLAEYVGNYETIAAVVNLVAKDGGLEMRVSLKPETAAEIYPDGVPEEPPIAVRFLSGKKDGFVYAAGSPPGLKGYFTRDAEGSITGVHIGGRFATRAGAVAAV